MSNNFLTKEQEKRVIDAISKAENQTSGEVRVHIENKCEGEPLERAEEIFHDLGMSATERKNGVLIYIATADRKAAVFAGKGIHKQVEDSFWNDVLKILLDHFKQQNYESGIVKAIEKVGTKLKEMYPHRQGDVNELPNDISYKNNSPE